ncbi:heavy metal translocating P-type ATPase [Noviherbaspirillum sedimenti]|uniref:Cation-translocating P-type ATPase n=1 Tax=Noviherbaspirillum sedimenti TaxID=2320865 RepID=A0A3A3FZE3_9BURK|nr:cation-translocating P-type ATPase [Noviherbaspirillum sedimenti]RJG01537.1 cation-translocating P-type ATPase [Noviherbaspirillum sedimenti]
MTSETSLMSGAQQLAQPERAKDMPAQPEPAPAELAHMALAYDKLAIGGMRCAACSQIIEYRVQHLAGVETFRINAASHRAELRWDPRRIGLREIVEAIAALGYSALPAGAKDSSAAQQNKMVWWRLFVAAFAMMQVMMYAFPAYLQPVPDINGDLTPDIDRLLKIASMVLTVPVVFFSSAPFFSAAWRDLRNRHVGMDVPVSAGILATFGASVWATYRGGPVYYDSLIMFVTLLLIARLLQDRVQGKSMAALQALTALAPLNAQRLPDYPASRRTEQVDAGELREGDLLLVAPGAQIPADGRVLEGYSECDEALMTGESQPVAKEVGAELVGGAINLSGQLVMRAERVGDATQLSALVQKMEAAANEKPPLVALADRHASRFMTAILVVALLAALVWWQIDSARALWIAISVLVVTCPCALSLAAPSVMAGAIGRLAKSGVLVARGRAVETLARATHFVFDKTGTLTEGRLQLAGVHTLQPGLEHAELLGMTAAIAAASTHPVSQALARAAAAAGIFGHGTQYTDLREVAGQGMEAQAGAQRYRLGNLAFVQELHGQALVLPPEFAGKTVSALGDERGWIALFALQDQIRADAAACIAFLRRQGKQVWLLSGDKHDVVAKVARELGIDVAHGELRPEHKHDMVAALQKQGALVAMVGDGMNDGPVLSLADVSIAMGQGAPIAQVRSDLVLMSNRLQDMAAAVTTTGRALALIRQNLGWALLYNLVAIPAAVSGLLQPWHAAIGMALSSLIVVLNSLRIFSRTD